MRHVLLCDDDLMNRKVASKILKKEGFNVIEATNGQEALDQLSHNSCVDLILMDLMMPILDGFETIQQIKSDPALSHIPVIIVSALSDTDALNRGLALGADAYITKPYNIEAFRLSIANTLEVGSSHV